MDNLHGLLNKDLNERRGCEACSRAQSTHVIFIHPKNMGGGACGVFHICGTCMTHPFEFGQDKEYEYIKKFV